MMGPALSVVIPVYNELENIPRLYEQLVGVARDAGGGGGWEFIFVDDASHDGTWEALRRLRAQDPRVRAIRLGRVFRDGRHDMFSAGVVALRDHLAVNAEAS